MDAASYSNNTEPLLSLAGKLQLYTFVPNITKYRSIDSESKPDITKNIILFDLLIEGYVRAECDLGSDYLFAISIKEIIASYYMRIKNLFTLRAYMQSKKEKNLLLEKCTDFWTSPFYQQRNILFCFVPLVTSIVAIMVCISYYDEPDHNYDYITHSAIFTLIGAIVCLLHILFIQLYRCVALACIDRINSQNHITMKSIKDTHKWLYLFDIISKLIMLIFYSVWTVIGFCIYHKKIQQSNVIINKNDKMMISWSVIIFISVIIYCANRIYSCIGNHCQSHTVIHVDYTMILTQKLEAKTRLLCVFIPFFILSICLVIIWNSADTLCDKNNFMPVHRYFIVISGCVAGLHMLIILGTVWFVIMVESKNVDIAGALSWMLCIFYFVWSIFGFYIYKNQMPSDCGDTLFGMLFILWCILAFVTSFIYHMYRWFAIFQLEYPLEIRKDFCSYICCNKFRIKILSRVLVICTYPLWFTSIGITIIAAYGNESICNNIHNVAQSDEIGIIPFLLTCGIVGSIYFTICLCKLFTMVYVNDVFGRRHIVMKGLSFCVGLFFWIWCIVGFALHAKMPIRCKQNIIGKMIILWSILNFITGPFYIIALSIFMEEQVPHFLDF